MHLDTAATPGDAIRVVNLREAFGRFADHWSPKVAGQINAMQVKLVKLQGAFVWHHHEQEDELFLVVKGRLLLRLRGRDLWLEEGEFAIIPHGVEHQPVAEEEVQVLLLEPAGTVNTGNVSNERTVRDLEQLP